jgi:hypothetical protein
LAHFGAYIAAHFAGSILESAGQLASVCGIGQIQLLRGQAAFAWSKDYGNLEN